ncbi:flagellar hook-length control protein FliK [Brachyspira pilosicoli P43/6/78]|uniref:Flagellar hook-length control protein FliK n=1 Tax=Brachyspira pilosicoli P43/6/78 TaxID=1042417 RepID=A0A3B6W0X4_BRAPL|nr:flagellar hook-length control protein FliK [Brachyspira pilosicoli]AGA67439.1 flagellar hook-length control protein FliK [Brachyspira pilosicoli P43/6/78]
MISSVSNVLSFNDSNISANKNNTIYDIHDDNSFAKMLDEAKNSEDIYSQSATNKSIEKEEDYQDSLYKNNNITDEDPQNNVENSENIRKENIENNADEAQSSELKESVNNEEKEEISENNSKEDKNIENAENIDNNEIKKDIMSSKEKAKKLIDKAGLIIENYKADKKAQIEKNVNIDSKVNEEKLSSLIKDIDDIKEELKNINLEELDEKDKKEITDLIIALESLEEIAISYQNDDDNVEKLSDIFELVEVEDNSIEETSKKSQDNNIEKIDAKIEENNNNEIVNDSAETFISNDDNNVADKREMRLQEAKENNNSNLNNTISDEKGSELTIINMKDSSSSLKGYNHYNNVSKTQNTNSLAENMIRFQDLMSKLVEKAQVAVNNGKSEVLMSLNPEYLGKVRLKISMDADNNLVGKIFVDNAEIKDIFTKNLDTVISSLNEIGINIEGFDVMLRQDMPNENGEFEFGGSNNNLNGFGADNIEEEVVSVQNYNIVPERKLNLLI